MKKYILFLLTILLITSCTKDDKLPLDNSKLGTIACNRAVIGINQKVLLACEVSVSPVAINTKIQWETPTGLTIEQDSYVDGISYCTYSFDAVGEQTIKCKATYLYGGEVVVAEKSFVAKVCQTDFLNSFRGDDKEIVKNDNPGIDEYGEKLIVSPTLYHQFMYDDDKFSVGHTFETKINTGTPNPKAAYSFFMTEVKKHEKRAAKQIDYKVWIAEYSMQSRSFTPTTEQEALFRKFESGELLDDTERIALGELVDNGTIKLAAMISTKSWNEATYGIMVVCSNTDTANTYQLITSFGLGMA